MLPPPLFQAIIDNKIADATALIQKSEDIDLRYEIDGVTHSPQSLALIHNRPEIYRLISKVGTQIKRPDDEGLGPNKIYPSVHCFLLTKELPAEFVREIIKDAIKLNPEIKFFAKGGFSKTTSPFIDKLERSSVDIIHKHNVVTAILHEALLRGEGWNVGACLKAYSSCINSISAQSVSEHIGTEVRFSKSDLDIRTKIINSHLTGEHKLSINNSEAIKKVFYSQSKVEPVIQSLPEPLKSKLAGGCNDTTEKLFAELHRYIRPNDSNEVFSLKATRNLLKEFLRRDISAILAQLLLFQDLDGENPATLCLAKILIFKHAESSPLNKEQSKPLLNEDDQRLCLNALVQFYQIKNTTKILFELAQQQQADQFKKLQDNHLEIKAELGESRAETAEARAEITQLRHETAQLKKVVETLSAHVGKLLSQLEPKPQVNKNPIGRLFPS